MQSTMVMRSPKDSTHSRSHPQPDLHLATALPVLLLRPPDERPARRDLVSAEGAEVHGLRDELRIRRAVLFPLECDHKWSVLGVPALGGVLLEQCRGMVIRGLSLRPVLAALRTTLEVEQVDDLLKVCHRLGLWLWPTLRSALLRFLEARQCCGRVPVLAAGGAVALHLPQRPEVNQVTVAQASLAVPQRRTTSRSGSAVLPCQPPRGEINRARAVALPHRAARERRA
mmetsp:Transcript_103054/g.274001  ORF Transcript_103054/g.274001 Transcript_103054/m.274001 type:complete len:228 (+) Transcript_103054:61-744(+)